METVHSRDDNSLGCIGGNLRSFKALQVIKKIKKNKKIKGKLTQHKILCERHLEWLKRITKCESS